MIFQILRSDARGDMLQSMRLTPKATELFILAADILNKNRLDFLQAHLV